MEPVNNVARRLAIAVHPRKHADLREGGGTMCVRSTARKKGTLMTAKFQVSFPPKLLNDIKESPSGKYLSRSAWLRVAAIERLERENVRVNTEREKARP